VEAAPISIHSRWAVEREIWFALAKSFYRLQAADVSGRSSGRSFQVSRPVRLPVSDVHPRLPSPGIQSPSATGPSAMRPLVENAHSARMAQTAHCSQHE